MNLIKMSENNSMTCYVIKESIVFQDNRVQFIEIINLKSPKQLGGGKLSLSSKMFEIIDFSTRVQTIYHMEIYEDLFAGGECLASGDASEPTRVIPIESLSYQNMIFLQEYIGLSG